MQRAVCRGLIIHIKFTFLTAEEIYPQKPHFVFLIPEVGLVSEIDVRCLEHGIFPGFFLLDVVFHAADGGTAEDDDHGQVDDRHESHQYVRGAPHKAEFHDGAGEDDHCGDDAEGVQESSARSFSAEVLQSHLRIVEVADQCSEGEQAERDGDEDRTESTQRLRGCRLDPGHSLELVAGRHA